MAKRSRRRYFGKRRFGRRHKDHRIPLIPTIAVVSTFISPAPSGRSIVQDAMDGDWEGLLYDAREKFAGIDNTGKLRVEWLIGTYSPIVIGSLVSKFAGKFINPSLKKIPFLGKYVRL